MNKYLLAASAAAVATLLAPAANASVTISCPGFSGLGYCTFNEVNKTGNFGDSFTSAQSFNDTFTLTLSQAYDLSLTMTNTAATGGPITFTTYALYDSAMTSLGNFAFGSVPTTYALGAGVYTLKVAGSASGSASYQGTIDVSAVPVPEPATWGLMLIGVTVLGAIMRRRLATARVAFS